MCADHCSPFAVIKRRASGRRNGAARRWLFAWLPCLPVLIVGGCVSGRSVPAMDDPIAMLSEGGTCGELPETVNTSDLAETAHLKRRVSPADESSPQLRRDPLRLAVLPADTFRLPVLATTTVNAHDPPFRVVTLEEIERNALANAASIRSARATASKAEGLMRQVGARPNPNVGYSAQQLADRSTDQHTAFVEQEWVRGDKLRLNRDVLRHTLQAQQAETSVQEFRVLTDVRLLFYEALAAQQRRRAIDSFAQVAGRGVHLAEQRQTAGEGSVVETLQAKTLLSEVSLAAEQADIAFRTTWEALAVIAAMPRETHVELEGAFPVAAAAIEWERVAANLMASSPELQVARSIVREKQALVRRHRAQPIPNLTTFVGAGYDREQDHGMINLQVAAPLPVRNNNQGNISAAHADYVRASQEVARIIQTLETRLAQVAREHQTAAAAVRKYEEEIIPQLQQGLELSELAYQAGELDFLQVLVVRRGYYEASLKLIVAQTQLAQATSRLDGLLLSGGLASPADYTTGDSLRGFSFSGQ